eukprot:CAMPEP_0174884944 /NCGR_PEP_ID=MMETSP0167-20121228/352_1 /TAXON_ID=38298 /ORGANISM="Rhodella maculata, Strain CCMP736" /LENGTH=42 /DNA_ID= /DNA_START= /DNA_END= /DNA_ORIENTATION=
MKHTSRKFNYLYTADRAHKAKMTFSNWNSPAGPKPSTSMLAF